MFNFELRRHLKRPNNICKQRWFDREEGTRLEYLRGIKLLIRVVILTSFEAVWRWLKESYSNVSFRRIAQGSPRWGKLTWARWDAERREDESRERERNTNGGTPREVSPTTSAFTEYKACGSGAQSSCEQSRPFVKTVYVLPPLNFSPHFSGKAREWSAPFLVL